MTISNWPVNERPREKLLDRGANTLSDAELLAIFLRTGISGKTAVDLARELLVQFGDLRGLLSASYNEIKEIKGLGPGKYVLLLAALELGRRHMECRLRRQGPLNSPLTTRQYLQAKIADYPHEVFACLFLDNRHRVICFEELFNGTIDGASVYPREVVKRALRHNAAALILCHNHPSGIAEPSQADRHITRRLVDALALVDIRVLDHIVIGDGQAVSFAERGLL